MPPSRFIPDNQVAIAATCRADNEVLHDSSVMDLLQDKLSLCKVMQLPEELGMVAGSGRPHSQACRHGESERRFCRVCHCRRPPRRLDNERTCEPMSYLLCIF